MKAKHIGGIILKTNKTFSTLSATRFSQRLMTINKIIILYMYQQIAKFFIVVDANRLAVGYIYNVIEDVIDEEQHSRHFGNKEFCTKNCFEVNECK